MNLAELREAIRVKTGYPERGDTGTKRLNNVLNQSLRQLWGEIPEVLLREEERLQLEPPRSFTVKLDPDDHKVFFIQDAIGTHVTNAERTDRIFSGRWIEWQYNGKWYQRRIAEVDADSDGTQTPRDIVVVTQPIPTEIASTSVAMSARIYTYEYPYDADIQSIRRIIKNPETNPREVPVSKFGDELDSIRVGDGWQQEGQINYYSRGDFYQQEAPHYTPNAVAINGQQRELDQATPTTLAWGYDSSGVEQRKYGPAGSFSYKVCHVWGRYPKDMDNVSPSYNNVVTSYRGRPFNISAPSKPSNIAKSVWPPSGEIETGAAIKLTLPDIEYIYGFGYDSEKRSYRRSGIEKWIFRARHDTTPFVGGESNGSIHRESTEDDGIYYLWRVVDGSVQEIIDRGDYDPVDRRYQLKDFMGHYHIAFDKRPTDKDQILMSVIRRPPTLEFDTDTPRLPPECYSCIIELACSYLVGDRDGDLRRKATYYDAHLVELQKLKRMYSFSGHESPSFGNGISSGRRRRVADYPVTEIT